ncbi:MAG: heme exporter protein CcmD [Alphaproteobacteria bacterium]|nr:heme exporter protein CcmD [Alphaproteobacteria bacterium]MBV9694749.1 heme exporter protein CcmD [Alphaproteobacteria bacterium]
MSGPYAAYVLAGYAVSAAALGAAVLLTVRGWLRARQRLAALDAERQP